MDAVYVIMGLICGTLCVGFCRRIIRENPDEFKLNSRSIILVMSALNIHTELNVCQSFVIESLKDIVPALLSTLPVLLTICNYRTARFFTAVKDIPVIIRLIYSTMSLVSVAGIITILTLSCQVYEGSKTYLELLRQI